MAHKVKNRSTLCTIILKVFNIYRRGIRLVHVLENFNRYIVRLLWCSETYDYQNEKNCWPGVVLETSVPSQRVPVNPALQVHLNCESSSCDATQVPPFKHQADIVGPITHRTVIKGCDPWLLLHVRLIWLMFFWSYGWNCLLSIIIHPLSIMFATSVENKATGDVTAMIHTQLLQSGVMGHSPC